MIFRITLIICLITTFSALSVAQKKDKNYNRGEAPKVKLFLVSGDSVSPLTTLPKNKESKIRVKLEGGMQNIKHEMYVTSKNASVKKDDKNPNDYLITPMKDEVCEIIVDVKTDEPYYHIKGKEVAKTYPPKTYMVGYERVNIK